MKNDNFFGILLAVVFAFALVMLGYAAGMDEAHDRQIRGEGQGPKWTVEEVDGVECVVRDEPLFCNWRDR